MKKISINILISLTVFICFPVFANDSLSENVGAITPERHKIAQAIIVEREAYVQTANYHPDTPEEEAALTKMPELVRKGQFKELLSYADELLKFNPYNLDALNNKVSAYERLGRENEMKETANRWVGIFDSILLSGDGTSFDTAYKIIAFNEEVQMLGLLGMTLESRKLVGHSYKTYHFLVAVNPKTKKKYEVYFEITRLFQTFKNDEIRRTYNVPLTRD
jgi:tetratricopeptide (TPR) repeat protein